MKSTPHHQHCSSGDMAVSEIIGSIMLISVVVIAVSVIGVMLLSQPTPGKLPALDAVISEDTAHNTIHIYHDGGDLIAAENIQILVDGTPTPFTKSGSAGWTTWSVGESLDASYTGSVPQVVQIVYTGSGGSTSLVSANFINEPGKGGSPTITPTPIITHTITASAGAGGSISPLGSIAVPDGSSQTFTFTPSSGYHITDVVVDSSSQGAVPSYTFTNVLADHTISVTFAVDVPMFTSITPPIGSTLGGKSVTITGTNLTGATAVTIGGTAATDVTVFSDTSITATTPFHAAGAVNVVVTTPGGTATGSGAYTYTSTAAPTFTSIAPAAGPTAGGTTVIITGTNFVTGGSLGVKIDGVAATGVVRNSATQITAVTPALPVGAKDVVITNNDGQTVTRTGAYTYRAAPTFTSITPDDGPIAGGNSVTITGTNLTGATTVTFGGTAATAVWVVSATQITATAPAHAVGAVNVVITTPGGIATGTGVYTYRAVPTFTNIVSGYGRIDGGTAVTITGTNFVIGATAVTFDGTAPPAFTVVSATQITATTPADVASTINVVVTTPGGTATRTYIYADPTITSTSNTISGARGTTATNIRINGANYLISPYPYPTVVFTQGSNTMTGIVTACTATRVTANLVIPVGQATGSYSVTVTNTDGGNATYASAFTVT
jgi:hypothetical protein